VRWDLHIVLGRRIVGPIAANAEVDRRGLDQRLNGGPDQSGRGRWRGDGEIRGQAVACARLKTGLPAEGVGRDPGSAAEEGFP